MVKFWLARARRALSYVTRPMLCQYSIRLVPLVPLVMVALMFSIYSVSKTSGQPMTVAHPPDGYVGSKACEACHAKIYKGYRQTDMGQSISEVTPEILRQFALPAKFYDQKMNRHYEVYARGGKLYQSEFETGAEGREVFRVTRPVPWVVGTKAVMGGIVQHDDYLFEAPLAFYKEPMTWKPAPGYEFADYSFSRPILMGCISCHSGRTNPVADTNGKYATIAFSQLEIGCENCHGPGAAHVKKMERGGVQADGNRAIVNPSRLSMEVANNLCMTCHEIGDERILQEGKSYLDIRPGVPLDKTLSVLMVPPTPQSAEKPDHLGHYYSMTLSKCYRASGGKLGCITCHDPHVQPSAQQAPGFFNQRCLTCHTDQSCGLPQAARQGGSSPDNCIGCHMPKRAVTFIAHTSLTNHRIIARPDEPMPESMFQQTTAELPDLIYLDPQPGLGTTPPPLLTLLQAYSELAADDPAYVKSYFAVLDQLAVVEPNHALVETALASRDLRDGKYQVAMERLQRALQLAPPQARVYALLSLALGQLGRSEEAVAAQLNAIKLDPFNPELQKTLVSLYAGRKQYGNAQSAIKHYLEAFPQDSYMRNMLAAAQGKSRQ